MTQLASQPHVAAPRFLPFKWLGIAVTL